jgi:hypothetical protein
MQNKVRALLHMTMTGVGILLLVCGIGLYSNSSKALAGCSSSLGLCCYNGWSVWSFGCEWTSSCNNCSWGTHCYFEDGRCQLIVICEFKQCYLGQCYCDDAN